MEAKTDWTTLTKMPTWGTMNVKTFNFKAGDNLLKTRKAIKAALESGQPVCYQRVPQKMKKAERLLKGNKILVCSCGQAVTVDANVEGVLCAHCTAAASIKKAGGFLHRGMAAMYENPPVKKEKKMPKSENKSGHMSVEAIRDRFDGKDSQRKKGYWQKVFSTIRQMKTVKVEDLAAKVTTYKSTPEKYKETAKMADQIRWYMKNIWGRKTQLAKIDGDTITYIPENQREVQAPKAETETETPTA